MQITQVKIHYKDAQNSKLKAFVTVTFDDMFVIHDLKVIEGKNGFFVAMPSVKRKETCEKCGRKTPVKSKFCNECGHKMTADSLVSHNDMARGDHKDIAHPITAEARDYVQKKVLEAFEQQRTEN